MPMAAFAAFVFVLLFDDTNLLLLTLTGSFDGLGPLLGGIDTPSTISSHLWVYGNCCSALSC